MNQRRRKLFGDWKLALAAVAIAHVGLGVAPALGQEIQLLSFADEWRFEEGATNRPPNWPSRDYDDSEWFSGPGVFGTPYYYNILDLALVRTRLSEATSGYNISRYFRRHFDFPNATNGVTLISSNLLDDGAIIYLNGVEIGRFGMPTGEVAHSTLPTRSGAVSAHGVDVLKFDPTNLVRGENILAAELHSIPGQTAFGMSLSAWLPIPITITRQPESLIVSNTRPATLLIETTGFPLFYQWQKDGVNLPNQTGATLHIANTHVTNSGFYRAIITNAISAVTSSVATLTVITDRDGPRLLAAVGNNIPNGGGSPFGSNTINVRFSEPLPLTSTSVRNTNNYILTRLGTANTVPILSALYSPALGALLNVDASDPDWTPGGDYVLTVSNVTDARGNVIAPDSQIAVSWPQTMSVIRGHHPWSFHNSWIFDPEPIATNWYSCDFAEGPWWATGYGPFCGGVFGTPPIACLAGCQTQLGFQPEPALFRTWFDWPANFSTESVTLRPRFAVDDGAIFYLNGVEIYRHNMLDGSINPATKAAAIIATPPCVTNLSLTVSNLVSGSNCLAVAVVQGNSLNDADAVFHFELDARYLLTPGLPTEPEPALTAAPLDADRLRLSWIGHGYALESATNLSLGAASYPIGPWQQVTNMSNPYTIQLDEAQRFFRLKK